LKINIGGYKHHNKINTKGWTIVDINPTSDVIIDLNKQNLPFSDNSIEAIYTSHTMEHILPHRQYTIFSEMYRVLQLNKKIRIVVPDIDYAIKKYINNEPLSIKGFPTKIKCLPNYNICWLSGWFFTYNDSKTLLGGHVMVYNKQLLTHYLKTVGFHDITFLKYNKYSEIFKECDLEAHKKSSIYVEAIK